MIDLQEKKRNIITFLETNGPSLPIQVARAISMEPVFTSAILSELLGDKKIKTSHMKVGSSPLYLLEGQEEKLEEYTENLKPIENEALNKIKEKKILEDENEEPAIRVALRNLVDFIEPVKENEKIIWKYRFFSEEEILPPEEPIVEKEPPKIKEKIEESEEKDEEPSLPIEKIQKEDVKKVEDIFSKEEPKKKLDQEKPRKTFLKEVEEFLEKKDIEIVSLREVDKKKVVAKTSTNSKESLLFAFNKKRITESELIKCYRQAKELNLDYQILTTGEPTKKMNDTIEAYKKLISIDNLQP